MADTINGGNFTIDASTLVDDRYFNVTASGNMLFLMGSAGDFSANILSCCRGLYS